MGLDDKVENWKDKLPTFKAVIDRIREYFGMDIKATRLNWFKDQSVGSLEGAHSDQLHKAVKML